MTSSTRFRAVLFDLGGVVLDSPLHAIYAFEEKRGIPRGFVDRLVVASAPDGAWHRLERGELEMGPTFFQALDTEAEAAGYELGAEAMMAAIAEASQPRPIMLEAIRRLRAAGLTVAALTNNWTSTADQPKSDLDSDRTELRQHFDHFIESSVVGLRKPDPRIYHLTCDQMGTEPSQVVFLDDIGSNLKSARALGMTTIKVVEPTSALAELEALVGLSLS